MDSGIGLLTDDRYPAFTATVTTASPTRLDSPRRLAMATISGMINRYSEARPRKVLPAENTIISAGTSTYRLPPTLCSSFSSPASSAPAWVTMPNMPPIMSTMKIRPAMRSRPCGMASSAPARPTGWACPGVSTRVVSNTWRSDASFSSTW